MKIVCVGGGPAGLYAALLLQQAGHAVTVVERNGREADLGWGVVWPEQTLARLALADAPSARAIEDAVRRWDAIEVDVKGQRVRSGGHGLCGIGRRTLLQILRQRAREVGVQLRFGVDGVDGTEAGGSDNDSDSVDVQADLVIGADGIHSQLRTRYAATFLPTLGHSASRFVWLGTTCPFAAFTFLFEETAHGWCQAHAYQYDGAMSTFIVEVPQATWLAAGLERMDALQTVAFCERVFARHLAGHKLLHQAGAPLWRAFTQVTCCNWVHWPTGGARAAPLVLIGDAAHSAHFSIGSGTRLALDDAIELARTLADVADVAGVADGMLGAALGAWQERRARTVARLQSAAAHSMEWFENVQRYGALDPRQFAYSLLTRSQRLSHQNLRLRDPAYIAGYEAWLATRAFASAGLAPPPVPPPPLFLPLRVRTALLKNRVVVAPTAQYCAVDGVVGDDHLVHLGARATGGAALVMTEMTAVSADARITPGCPGLYTAAQKTAWRRVVDFVHGASDALIGVQLGHAGARGSTRRAWDGIDLPLDAGNWPLLSASPQQYLAGVSQIARAASHADLARILADFVAATHAAQAAGFDWLELHCAHGDLLSSFLSPLTNQRDDSYGCGGSLAARCRYPLAVFAAVRAAWPAAKPISVRLFAHDWVEGGMTPDDAVQVARLFRAAGADLICCSSGQVSQRAQPRDARMYQVPLADRIRNEAGIATIAIGAIEDGDQANGIIAAGRADLCAVGRAHLANPAWTLMEAAKLGYHAPRWPRAYLPARAQPEPSVTFLHPPGWPRAKGYSNGVAARGRTLHISGMVGWDADGQFQTDDFTAQAHQALLNIVAVLAEGGAAPAHIVRLTWYVIDRAEYLAAGKALGVVYRAVMGQHYPAMSALQVAGLMEPRARLEIEATAMVPD